MPRGAGGSFVGNPTTTKPLVFPFLPSKSNQRPFYAYPTQYLTKGEGHLFFTFLIVIRKE